jgi:hypothetical protein
VLFSHPELAAYMSERFECAWESVRPVPRVTIDFGDGRTLERTLHGNIVTYFCNAQGQVYDLVPGLVDTREYQRRLEQAERLERAVFGEAVLPLRTRFGAPMEARTVPFPLDSHETQASAWKDIVALWHRQLVARSAVGDVGDDPIQVFDGSKFRVEHGLEHALASPESGDDTAALRRDTEYNRHHRVPLASRLLLEHPLPRPESITKEVYRRVLGVDLDDPYLGLAPHVLGGEGGRQGPASAESVSSRAGT